MPQTVGHVPVVAIEEAVVAAKVVTVAAAVTTEDATVDLADHPREMARKRATKKTIRIDLRLTRSQDDHFITAVEAEEDADAVVVIADVADTVDDRVVMARVMTTSIRRKMKVVKANTTIRAVIAEETEKVEDVHDDSEDDQGDHHKALAMKEIANIVATIVNIAGMTEVAKEMTVPVANTAVVADSVDEDREEISARANQRVTPKVAILKVRPRSNTMMTPHHPGMMPHHPGMMLDRKSVV